MAHTHTHARTHPHRREKEWIVLAAHAPEISSQITTGARARKGRCLLRCIRRLGDSFRSPAMSSWVGSLIRGSKGLAATGRRERI